jgi:hypothetical protein
MKSPAEFKKRGKPRQKKSGIPKAIHTDSNGSKLAEGVGFERPGPSKLRLVYEKYL